MTARQVFFGALGFASARELDAVTAEVLGPDVLGPQPPAVLDVLGGARRDRALVLSFEAYMPSSLWHPFVGTLHELAARAQLGRVGMLYAGDGTETSVAAAPDRGPASPDVRVTQRHLRLDRPVISVARGAGHEALELDVVRRSDGTPGLDTGDWLGFFGVLFERGEALFFDTGRSVYDWAQPAEPGTCRVLSSASTELVVVVEVLGPRPLPFGGAPREDAIAIAVHSLVASGDAFAYQRAGWRERAQTTRTVFLAPGAGLVAIE